MKIITIIGARPQFIKAAAVSRALHKASVTEILVHTGQHFDDNMSEVFFGELGIPAPKYNLGINNMGHGAMTGRMLEKIEEVLLNESPTALLVYGDTNSTIAGALAAAKLHIPVAHVEAGLRSFNRRMPEEINRILTDHASSVLYTPTSFATRQLYREGIPADYVVEVGDVMYDASLFFADKAEAESTIGQELGLDGTSFVLATIHRAENTNDLPRLKAIFTALREFANTLPVILPLHPRTAAIIEQQGIETNGISLIDPLGYLDMTYLEKHAKLIITDSGGVQKEAYFQKVPCVTLRNETEYVELVETGWNEVIIPSEPEEMIAAFHRGLDRKGTENPSYGDGNAADLIARDLLKRFG